MYKNIRTESDPKIIGVNNGVYQVELNDRKSFVNKEEKKNYENYFDGNFNSFSIDNFKNIEKNKVTILTYFPLKKAKETDFVSFSPNEMGLNFIISQKVLDIFESFNLCEFIKIPTKIEGFKNNFYTIGFPITNYDFLDFPESFFLDSLGNRNLIESYEEYDVKRYDIKVKKLKLRRKTSSNIIYSQIKGLFFSNELVEKLRQEDVVGFQICDTELDF
ncbi:hypothetical protein CFS9_27470 [Flavobacterium sp. CFS9]|uniref:Immunity protein 43 n=1 Tax=Flavobacterium sp. CFS9 TaxID=3143118 RepID=A0AAT9H3Y7_9FLAO